MSVHVPQYLHLPVQIVWFDSHEVAVLVLGLALSLIIQSWLWVPIMGACSFLIHIKRKRPRGWILHLFYRMGIMRIKGMPLPTARRFDE